jgi:hypothetical protein
MMRDLVQTMGMEWWHTKFLEADPAETYLRVEECLMNLANSEGLIEWINLVRLNEGIRMVRRILMKILEAAIKLQLSRLSRIRELAEKVLVCGEDRAE